MLLFCEAKKYGNYFSWVDVKFARVYKIARENVNARGHKIE